MALTCLISASFLACSSGGSAAIPRPGTPVVVQGSAGRLLFTRDAALSIMDLGTAQSTQIVAPPELGQVHSARFSPDGTKIVYSVYEVRDRRTPVAEIYTATATGTGATKLMKADVAATFYQAPVWGLSGKIYFMHVATSGQERIRQIESITLSSGKVDVVFPEVGAFDVSPDEKWLSMVRNEGNGVLLALIDLASGEAREIVPRGQFEVIAAPRFDPTSKTIAFSATRSGGAWAPSDRTGIASRLWSLIGTPNAHAHGSPQDVWSVPVAGGATIQLAKIDADEPTVAWSPDGGSIAILSSEGLASFEIAGAVRKPILTPGGYGTVDWAR